MRNKGNLACFYHKEGGQEGVNRQIHSVFDISFDESKGEMKIYSVMSKGVSGTTSKTTYASDVVKDKKGKVIKTGKNIGYMAANAAKDKNAYRIWEILKQLISDKAVVNESAIVGGINYWGGNESYGGAANTNRLDNPADDKTVTSYQKYRKLQKVAVKDSKGQTKKAKEIGKEITLDKKSYTVIGPFKVKLGGKNITEVKVADAVWNSKTSGQIFWKFSAKNMKVII